ncbi:sulfotransferase [Rhodoligotrophos defluvii]|uniref:sulfotransferase n=1 Tax=Rhodoligotrophos defluvii TaxID=2561934 RepID=UPI001961521E|nr:sulfotransferase [Rhodoligotrophos defluvii]
MKVDPWTDLLGGLIERHPRLWVRLGDWETRLVRESVAKAKLDRPIYIAGLARSGSTILLELLSRHTETATHRYRDFPMLLTPWAWNWFVDRAGSKKHEATERAHRDRILVTPESPEAFEEVIWSVFFPGLHDPAKSAVLDMGTSNPHFERFYQDHIRKLLILRGGSRYLAKGNYNVTRIGYLRKLFPDARFLIPIRHPVWHVASLMKQHRLFSAAGAEDDRVRRQMRRSGHFEFGLDRRPINVGDQSLAEEIGSLWRNGEEIAGWATLWAGVYGHIADCIQAAELGRAARIVRYEDLCADPGAILSMILDHCDLDHQGLPDLARAMIARPTYYHPAFSRADRDTIRVRTEDVAARFGYDLSADD